MYCCEQVWMCWRELCLHDQLHTYNYVQPHVRPLYSYTYVACHGYERYRCHVHDQTHASYRRFFGCMYQINHMYLYDHLTDRTIACVCNLYMIHTSDSHAHTWRRRQRFKLKKVAVAMIGLADQLANSIRHMLFVHSTHTPIHWAESLIFSENGAYQLLGAHVYLQCLVRKLVSLKQPLNLQAGGRDVQPTRIRQWTTYTHIQWNQNIEHCAATVPNTSDTSDAIK